MGTMATLWPRGMAARSVIARRAGLSDLPGIEVVECDRHVVRRVNQQ